MTKFFFISIVLISFTIGTYINYISPQDKNYLPSGLIGGNLAELFISFFSELGTFLFIIVSFLVLLRGYFDLNYYKPFENLINTIKKLKNNRIESVKNKEVEEIKRKHTEVLKEKIIYSYDNQNKANNRGKVFPYLVDKRCRRLLEDVKDFI